MTSARGHGYHDSVFVFGSNRLGIHGAGAAAFARQYRGAVIGQGEGLMGSSYALPTKADLGKTRGDPGRVLEIQEIAQHVDRFLDFARENPQHRFMVTAVGCGLAGFTHAEVAPLFTGAPENCLLPGIWLQMLQPESTPVRVIVAGSRTVMDPKRVEQALDRVLARFLKETLPLEIISGMAKGPDSFGRDWSLKRDIPVVEYPADWDLFGKRAGFLRNQEMAWYGTHLIAIWDGASNGTRHMIETARNDGLNVRVVV